MIASGVQMSQFPKSSYVTAGVFFFLFLLIFCHLEGVRGRLENARKNLIEVSEYEGERVTAANNGSHWEKMKSSKEEQELMIDADCYLPETCIDEANNLLACLKNPGQEPSGLLHLILHNKGAKAITVTIAAPAFVQPEQATVRLEPNYAKQVVITPGYDGVDSSIILTTDEGRRCSLDFRESDIILHSTAATNDITGRDTYAAGCFYNVSAIHLAAAVCVLALIALALICKCWCGCGIFRGKDHFRRGEYEMVNDAERLALGRTKAKYLRLFCYTFYGD